MSQKLENESESFLRLFELIDDDAEKTVLAAMRDDYSMAEEFSADITYECFYDQMRSLAFRAMIRLAFGNDPYEPQIIAMEGNRISREENLGITLSADFIRSFAGPIDKARSFKALLKERSEKRKLHDIYDFGIRNLNNMTSFELVAETRKRLEEDAPKSKGERITYGATTQEYLMEELHKEAVLRERGITTPRYPWRKWNDHILPPDAGKLTLLGAPDGIGKSTLAHRIAECYAQQGFSVAFVHAEDPLKKILKRRMCHYTELPIDHITVGSLDDKVFFKGATQEDDYEIQDANRRIAEWSSNLHYVNMIDGNILDCVYELESMKKDGKCDYAIIDYIGAFLPTRGHGRMEKHARIADEADRLVAFSGKIDVPVFAVVQGTKEMLRAQGDDIGRAHLYGGASLYQRAGTVILFLRQKLTEGAEIRDQGGHLVASDRSYSPHTKIIVDKQNDGDSGTFNQFFEGRYYSVHDQAFWL